MPTVKGGARMRGDVDRAHRVAACRVEGVQLVTGRKPGVSAVKGHAIDAVDAGKRAVFADDFSF
jgi:hypothetical protein